MSQRDTVVLMPDPLEGAYTVLVPALPRCISRGANLDEALGHAREAIEGHIAAPRDIGEPVPVEVAPLTVTSVDVTTDIEAPV